MDGFLCGARECVGILCRVEKQQTSLRKKRRTDQSGGGGGGGGRFCTWVCAECGRDHGTKGADVHLAAAAALAEALGGGGGGGKEQRDPGLLYNSLRAELAKSVNFLHELHLLRFSAHVRLLGLALLTAQRHTPHTTAAHAAAAAFSSFQAAAPATTTVSTSAAAAAVAAGTATHSNQGQQKGGPSRAQRRAKSRLGKNHAPSSSSSVAHGSAVGEDVRVLLAACPRAIAETVAGHASAALACLSRAKYRAEYAKAEATLRRLILFSYTKE